MAKVRLKLNIYRIRIQKRGSKASDNALFKDFFKEKFGKEDESDGMEIRGLYQSFIRSYMQSFNDKFCKNEDGTKAFVPQKDQINFSSDKHIIFGYIKGGDTGIDREIFDEERPDERESTMSKSKISALPFYFLLWTPFDSNHGILMMQNYSGASYQFLF